MANQANTSNVTLSTGMTIEQTSISILRDSMAPNLVASVITFFGIVTNALVMITIVKTKELHNKSQLIIFSHSLAEFLFAVFSFSTNSFRKFLYVATNKPDTTKQLHCIFALVPVTAAANVTLLAILALCVDRLLAIGAPIEYKKLPRVKYIITVNTICWGIVFVHVPFMFFDFKQENLLPICQYALAVGSTYRSYAVFEGNILTAITIVLYILAISIVSCRYWGKKWQNDVQRTNWARQIQMSAFKIMMTVGCIYLSCWGSGGIILYVLTSYTNPMIHTALGPYVSLLNNLNGASHFFVYFGLSKSFRKAFFGVFSCKTSNVVTPVITLQ